jgi:hypothetical protein
MFSFFIALIDVTLSQGGKMAPYPAETLNCAMLEIRVPGRVCVKLAQYLAQPFLSKLMHILHPG